MNQNILQVPQLLLLQLLLIFFGSLTESEKENNGMIIVWPIKTTIEKNPFNQFYSTFSAKNSLILETLHKTRDNEINDIIAWMSALYYQPFSIINVSNNILWPLKVNS